MHAPAPGKASALPSLDRLLRDPAFAGLIEAHGRSRVTMLLRERLQAIRGQFLADAGASSDAAILEPTTLAQDVAAHVARQQALGPPQVFNLTGTVLHTNLGRACLPEAAIATATQAMRSPVGLEYELERGRRGQRDQRVRALLCELTGAQDATVVNNNAAAVLLLLDTLAKRREVLVSRGELVEIGGSFRIPDVMRAAGVRLVEVGTTNRTHLRDYEEGIGSRTALLMQVHASNFAITGFTASVDAAALARLARERGLPLALDLGSGSLCDLRQWGLPHEPTVREALDAGADLVTFSGDKLLGGPQAGLIAGRGDLVARIRRNPLMRALRVDKMTLAALEAVLGLYREPELLQPRLPTLRWLARPVADIRQQALRLQPLLQAALGQAWDVQVAAMDSQVGSGAQPRSLLASAGLCIRASGGRKGGSDALARRLRALPRPLLGRIADDALWLDLRCLEADDEAGLAAQLQRLAR